MDRPGEGGGGGCTRHMLPSHQPLACSSGLEPGGALDCEAMECQDSSTAKVSSDGDSTEGQDQCASLKEDVLQ